MVTVTVSTAEFILNRFYSSGASGCFFLPCGVLATCSDLLVVLDQDLNHDVLELDIQHGRHRLLLGSQQGGAEYHAHVGRRHQVLAALAAHAGEQNTGHVNQRSKDPSDVEQAKTCRSRHADIHQTSKISVQCVQLHSQIRSDWIRLDYIRSDYLGLD